MKRPMRRAASLPLAVAIVALGGSLGCSTNVPGSATASDDVVGGRVDATRTATVSVASPHGSCSGALVAAGAPGGRGSVLTAAHCLRGGMPTEVVVGDDATASYAFHFPVRAAVAHPQFDFAAQVSDYDFAVLTIDGIDTSWPIHLLATDDQDATLAVGDAVTLSGFGLAAPGAANNTLRREATLAIDAVSSTRITSSWPGRASCGGDSGSPVLAVRTLANGTTREVQVGVHSFGTAACSGEVTAMRVASARDWILAQLVR